MLSATCTSRTLAWIPARVARAGLAACALLLLPAPAARTQGGAARPDPAPRAPAVVVLSLDGTTPGMLERAGTPALAALARAGAVVAHFEPVFPSNTFPNHVTLMTGVRPEKHGIVNNSFRDPQRGVFDKSNDPSWIQAEPLWSRLAARGIPSASFHWVGSEGPWTSGRGPREWRSFDAETKVSDKLAQILAWLDPETTREPPRLVSCWLPGADRVAHARGPEDPAVAETLRAQDRELAGFVSALEARGAFAWLTLFVVSDHGMARVERNVDLRGALEDAGLEAGVYGAGGFATLHLAAGGDAIPRAQAAARGLGLEAYPRARAPAGWPVANARFGDVVVVAPIGTAISSARSLEGFARGMHGYRSELPEMEALFLARGRGVVPGTRIERARSVDLVPTLLELLGLPPAEELDGRSLARELAGAGRS